jgi:hypothetical protein
VARICNPTIAFSQSTLGREPVECAFLSLGHLLRVRDFFFLGLLLVFGS